MLQISNNRSGSLEHLAPHVSHTVIDKSGVPAPEIRYSGTTSYFVVTSERGPSGEVKKFYGAKAFSEILETYGKPNVTKYGLPLSAAVLHASYGGAAVIQSVKAPSAAHAAVVITAKLRLSRFKQRIGHIFRGTVAGGGLVEVDDETKPMVFDPALNTRVHQKKLVTAYSAANIRRANSDDAAYAAALKKSPAFVEQFIPEDVNHTMHNLLTGPIVPGKLPELKMGDKIDGSNVTVILDAQINARREYNKLVEDNFNEYKKLWSEVTVSPIEVSFESYDIAEYIDKKRKEYINATPEQRETMKPLNFTSVNSWEVLNSLASEHMGTSDPIDVILRKIDAFYASEGQQGHELDDYEFEFPIIWGFCKGKGLYGNRYSIQFTATTEYKVENERPLMFAKIIDNKTGLVVKNSEKIVSISNDYYNNLPILIDTAYSMQNEFDGEFKFATASKETFDDLGMVIQHALKRTFNFLDGENGSKFYVRDVNKNLIPVEPLFANDSYGPKGDFAMNQMKELVDQFDEAEDSNYHRLSKTDLTRLPNSIGFLRTGGLQNYRFNGGDEGEFKFMREFDWDFNFEDKKLKARYEGNPEFELYRKKWGKEKIVQKVFIDAYDGKYDITNISLYHNPADYIVDLGYPAEVKSAIYQFAYQKRDDIQLLFNTDINVNSISEARANKNALNFSGRNAYWWTDSFEWVDNLGSGRPKRVPTTLYLLRVLIDHYQNGFAAPIAGVTRGMLEASTYTSKFSRNMLLEEKDLLIKDGINILSVYKDNRVYLDSQMANYNLHERSSLQEFHNNSILNRIIKDIYDVLQQYKHMLTSDQAAAQVEEVVNNLLTTKYRDKVAEMKYSCGYGTLYNRAIGLFDHNLQIRFNNTVKYHHVNITALGLEG